MGDYKEIRVDIPAATFKPVGESEDEDETTGQLLASLVIHVGDSAVHMHLDAIAVTVAHGLQTPADDSNYSDDSLADIHNAVGADGHFDTITIGDREYVLICTPYC